MSSKDSCIGNTILKYNSTGDIIVMGNLSHDIHTGSLNQINRLPRSIISGYYYLFFKQYYSFRIYNKIFKNINLFNNLWKYKLVNFWILNLNQNQTSAVFPYAKSPFKN